MGAYGFGEHYTHHRVPGIPYYHLAAATSDMAREDESLKPEKDYFRVLAEIALR
jgi:fatty acid desaturase